MGCDQKAPAATAAKTLQQPATPAAQLFVAVDDQNHRRAKPAVAVEIQREPPLAVVQFDKRGMSPGTFDRRNQRGQQCRLAGAVAADDFAPPAVLLQPLDQRFRVLAGREKKRHGPRPNPPRAKRVFGGFVGHGKLLALTRSAGVPPAVSRTKRTGSRISLQLQLRRRLTHA